MNLTAKIVKKTDNFNKLQLDNTQLQPTANKPFPQFIYIENTLELPEKITITVVK